MRVASISVKEYLEGLYRQVCRPRKPRFTIAMEKFAKRPKHRSNTRIAHVSQGIRQVAARARREQFAFRRAQFGIDSARTAKEVLEKFTKLKTIGGRYRVRSRQPAPSLLESEKAAFTLEGKIGAQASAEPARAQCVINRLARRHGRVCHEQSAGILVRRRGRKLRKGLRSRTNRDIFRLPDLIADAGQGRRS